MRAAVLALLLMFTLAHAPEAAPIDTSKLVKFDCPGFGVPANATAYCGHLEVPERADGTGRKINLAVVVVTPKDPVAAANVPTVFVHGGPGVGVVDFWWSLAEEPFAFDAPLIVFDQRAVGTSKPKLCEWLDDDDPTLDRMRRLELGARAKQDAARCTEELRKQNVDLTAYGTDANARDMEAIRAALKIEKWNVFGISYGTTVALAYLAAHPERTRAAVIDSVYPPEVKGISNVSGSTIAALDRIAALCNADADCRSRHGDLRLAVEETIRTLDADPVPIHTPFPWQKENRYMSGSTFVGLLLLQLYDPDGWYVLPRFIEDARHRKQSRVAARMFEMLQYIDVDSAVWLATECRERAPFDTKPPEADPRWPEVTSALDLETTLAICAAWPAKMTANWTTPRNTTVPTLVINGALDPVTPAADARATAQILGPNAQFLLVANAGHSPSTSIACAENVVKTFLQRPDRRIAAAPCSGTPPILASDIVEVDFAGALVLSIVDVPQAMWIVLAAILGLIAAMLWPFARLTGKGPPETPFWRRASFWFPASAFALLLWSEIGRQAANAAGNGAQYWLLYGKPVNAWPAFSLIVASLLFALAGLWAFMDEVGRGTLKIGPAFLRLWVALSLGLTFAALWSMDILPQAFTHLPGDVERTSALIANKLAPLLQ